MDSRAIGVALERLSSAAGSQGFQIWTEHRGHHTDPSKAGPTALDSIFLSFAMSQSGLPIADTQVRSPDDDVRNHHSSFFLWLELIVSIMEIRNAYYTMGLFDHLTQLLTPH